MKTTNTVQYPFGTMSYCNFTKSYVCCFFYRTHDSDSSSNDENYPIPQRFFSVTCTGRQPNMQSEVDEDVFVFGPDLQIDCNGMMIPESDRKYIWVPEILKQLRQNVNPIQILPPLPTQNALNYVITGINRIAGDNTCSGIFLLGRCIYSSTVDACLGNTTLATLLAV